MANKPRGFSVGPDSITIDIPGAFDSFFSLSGVGQGETSREKAGYLGAPGLYKAYTDSARINCGKGYRLRLTIPRDEMIDAVLYCLWHYADTCYCVNQDNASSGDNEARTEMRAGQTTRLRVEDLADVLDLDLDPQ